MTRQLHTRLLVSTAVAFALLAGTSGQAGAQQASQGQKLANAAQHKDMDLVGHNDLQARSAYQPWVQRQVVPNQGTRWIAYVGHHGGSAFNPIATPPGFETNGTSIVDVTDPRRPQYLKHLPGPSGEGEAGGAQMVRVCNGSDLPNANPNKVYMLRSHGDIAHQVWDVTNPSNPILVSTPVESLDGTHKSWWECDTGIAYLVSGLPGWRTNRMTQVFDLSNPAAPQHIRDYGLVGQQPGSAGPVPQSLHGPISTGPTGIHGKKPNRVYFGHGTGSNGILQIVDRSKLLDPTTCLTPPSANWRTNPTPDDLLCPQLGRLDTSPTMGAHTVYPLLGQTVPEFVPNLGGPVRDIIVLVNEAGGGSGEHSSGEGRCTANRQLVYMVDITTESKPMGVANFQVPEESGDFCHRGGRFGAHASNENFTPIYYGKLVFVSWFNAGVRAIDVRDPWSPREAAYFIPETTANTDVRCTTILGERICNFVIQTNNVEVDDRGLIYIVDRANTGLHILELSGDARRIIE